MRHISKGGSIMKKTVFLILAAVIFILSSALPSQADGRGGHGGFHVRSSIWFGPGWWGPWGYPYYYDPYYPYSYPYYAEPSVVIEKQAPVYVQPNRQQEESDYWYFCTKPQGYYPYIKRCPVGWLKVVPSAPSDRDSNDAESSQHEQRSKNAPPSTSNEKRY
jgi:hypothetical protein